MCLAWVGMPGLARVGMLGLVWWTVHANLFQERCSRPVDGRGWASPNETPRQGGASRLTALPVGIVMVADRNLGA